MLHIIKSIHVRKPDGHVALHKSFKGMHAVYFGAVLFEGHGIYAATGGALMVLTVLDWFVHFEE